MWKANLRPPYGSQWVTPRGWLPTQLSQAFCWMFLVQKCVSRSQFLTSFFPPCLHPRVSCSLGQLSCLEPPTQSAGIMGIHHHIHLDLSIQQGLYLFVYIHITFQYRDLSKVYPYLSTLKVPHVHIQRELQRISNTGKGMQSKSHVWWWHLLVILTLGDGDRM